MSDKKQPENAPQKEEETMNFEAKTAEISKESLAETLPEEKTVEEEIDNELGDTASAVVEESKAQEVIATNSDDTQKAAPKDEPKDIPVIEYSTLEIADLIEHLNRLINDFKVQDIKDAVDGIKKAADDRFDEEQEKAKAQFLEEGGNIIDFRYNSPLRKQFNATYYEYRDKRSNYYQKKRKNQEENLKEREALIEELKSLRNELGGEESVNSTYTKFKDIQERWHHAGNIPRDRYNLVWNNYYHHVDSFYELLHLNRAFRDKHYEENLAQKMQLIERAEELAEEKDVRKAFKELQLLHSMWKEEIGPVAKEHSDAIWDQFSAATKVINDKKHDYYKELDASYEKNLEAKRALIDKINEIAEKPVSSHKEVQQRIQEVEALRTLFFKAGKVPSKVNEATWKSFKDATRAFNKKKNGFYKGQKQEQFNNLAKKQALLKQAEENKETDDFSSGIELFKKIQAEWKTIGHVPRKDSDKIWKSFKEACNHFFTRLHESKNKATAEEEEAFKQKEALLEKMDDITLEKDAAGNLDKIKEQIEAWKDIGRVPYSKKKINDRFNKAIDKLFKDANLDKSKAELIKYDAHLEEMKAAEDSQKIEREHFYLSKKSEELAAQINQLENNLGFFQHVPDDNPMVKEVHKNINNHKKELEIIKNKIRKIKSIK